MRRITYILIGLTLVSYLAACSGGKEKSSTSATVEAEVGDLQFPTREDMDPLTLRRATLIVRDIDRSLALYRDAIGMEVIYDNIIRRPHRTEDRQQEIWLVFLKASHNYIGVLGLVDYEL